jgi:hypothetical protein
MAFQENPELSVPVFQPYLNKYTDPETAAGFRGVTKRLIKPLSSSAFTRAKRGKAIISLCPERTVLATRASSCSTFKIAQSIDSVARFMAGTPDDG